MRIALFSCTLLAACSNAANHLGNPLLLPINALTHASADALYTQRRGQVELVVKSGFDQIITDLRTGGGPILEHAMATAHIPATDTPARILQMQGDIAIYTNNPEALITALMVYGGQT